MNKFRSQRVPPFQTFVPGSRIDFFTWWGANELARRIKEAWKKVGYDINPVVEKAPELGSHIMSYVVRIPDLVNGLPINKEK